MKKHTPEQLKQAKLNRELAISNNILTYNGVIHNLCGTSFKYVNGSCCVACLKNRRKKYKATPKARRNQSLKFLYNISLDQYIELFNQQNGLCKVCGFKGSLDSIYNRKNRKYRLFVDHDHLTKEVRGLLCQLCNLALGALKDDIGNVERLSKYLQESTLNFFKPCMERL